MGAEIAALRKNNIRLRKYVCFFKQFYDAEYDTDMEICPRDMECERCGKLLETSVSQEELGRVLGESKHVVASWETAGLRPICSIFWLFALSAGWIWATLSVHLPWR